MLARAARAETEFAQKQPGRIGMPDPASPWNESELGRFCQLHGLRREVKEAGEAWKELRRLFIVAWGGPIDEHHGGRGFGEGPSMATQADWKTKMRRIEEKLLGVAVDDPDTGRMNKARYAATKSLCLDDKPVSRELSTFAKDGLRILAVEFGKIGAKDQPFQRAA